MIFSEMKSSFLISWQKRELRDRRMWIAVAAFVVVSLIYLIGIDPAISQMKNLETYLPKLKQQVALMENMTGQYAVISKAMSDVTPPLTKETLEASLTRRSIATQSLSVSGDVVRLQMNTVGYANLMEWILEMQKAARLTVDEAKVTMLGEPGQVSAVLVLRQQRAAN